MNPGSVPAVADQPPPRSSRWRDLVLALVLMAGAGIWATTYWNTWWAKGGRPEFYQNYFEPAVMTACGKGFVITQGPQPAALAEFLQQRRDRFDCAELPPNLALGPDGLFQGAWIYLEMMVGWSWRVLGISWSGMGPLFGLLFGITIALAYAIFRLGMNQGLAVIGALGLTVSAAHLMNLPNLRDYAKAPFTLGLVLVLGLLVMRPVRRATVLGLAAAFGALLGIGYGFRTDFLVQVPILLVVLFAFLDGGLRRHLGLKAGAAALFAITFLIVASPVLTSVLVKGGCQWHVALLGLQSPFDAALKVAPAPYDFGYAYSDGYIDGTIRGYANRVHPGIAPLQFCSAEYDVQSGEYLRAIALSFPADLAVRGYGSVLQIAELPFLWWASPMAGWFDAFYAERASIFRPLIGQGVYIVALALLLSSAASLRLACFLLFFVLYFGGYPALQFQTRHHFHLEFMTWWAAGFLIQRLVAAGWSLRGGFPAPRLLAAGAGRLASFAVMTAVVLAGTLAVARWYQQGRAEEIFEAYLSAPKVPLVLPGGALPVAVTPAWPQFLEVELNEAACGPQPAVTFRHNTTVVDGDLSRTFVLDRKAPLPGPTRILLPVFSLYKSIEFSDEPPGCVVGASMVGNLSAFPLLLGAVLPPDWRDLPLHQSLKDWESDWRQR